MTSKITGTGSLYLKEQAAALAEVGASGQVWVDDATPNTLMFTNDAGTDEQLSGLGYQSVVQVVNVTDGEVATGTTTTPDNDTIPQITEGNEYMTLAITPKSATNILKIEVVWVGAVTSAARKAIALFQDSTADTLAVVYSYMPAGQSNSNTFVHYMTAGTVSATTFRVRVGSSNAGTTTFNGDAGNRYYGGRMSSSITITEYTP